MRAEEFIKWLNNNNCMTGMWSVEPKKEVFKQYVMGCFWDSADKKWKVYANEEKGKHIIYIETESEEDAYAELQSMILFEQRNNKGYY